MSANVEGRRQKDEGRALNLDSEKLALARKTIRHVLGAICEDPRKFWLLGNGTESYALLTECHAFLSGQSRGDVRHNFKPEEKGYRRFCLEQERRERLLRICEERGITADLLEENYSWRAKK